MAYRWFGTNRHSFAIHELLFIPNRDPMGLYWRLKFSCACSNAIETSGDHEATIRIGQKIICGCSYCTDFTEFKFSPGKIEDYLRNDGVEEKKILSILLMSIKAEEEYERQRRERTAR